MEHRKVNLKIHHPEITESNLLESVYSLMKKIVTNFAIADDYLEFCKNIWEDDSYRKTCPEFFSMVEIFLCESPANVFAESMGRFMNMIRNNLKN